MLITKRPFYSDANNYFNGKPVTHMYSLKLYGPPGTGKTHSGMKWLTGQVENGADPERLAFVSYTNAACDEGRARICQQFNRDPDEVPYCATIHALARRALRIQERDWLVDPHLGQFAAEYGYDLKSRHAGGDEDDLERVAERQGKDAPFLAVWDFGRHRLITDPREAWMAFASYDPEAIPHVPWVRFEQFVKDYETYKTTNGLRDFTDLLSEAIYCARPLPADAACVDEAQDLTPLMWAAAEALLSGCDRVAVLGDPNQAIYGFTGATPALLMDRAAKEAVTLAQSYRLPRQVSEHAASIIRMARQRLDADVTPTDGFGLVDHANSLRDLDMSSGETWMVLIRNWKLFGDVTLALEEEGIPYHVAGSRRYSPWDDKGAYRSVATFLRLADGESVPMTDILPLLSNTRTQTKERSGAWVFGAKKRIEDRVKESPAEPVNAAALTELGLTQWGFDRLVEGDINLLARGISERDLHAYTIAQRRGTWGKPPLVTVSSIHGVKGQEADHVAVIAACTGSPYRALYHPLRRDEEVRVAYVAATRARKVLHIVRPWFASAGIYPWEIIG